MKRMIPGNLKRIPETILKYPVELLLSITAFVLGLLAIEHLKDWPELYFENAFYASVPLFVLTFSLNRPGWKWRIPYILSYFLWIPVLLCYKKTGMELHVAYLLAAILLLIGKEKTDNAGYAQNVVRAIGKVAIVGIVAILLFVLLIAIIRSVDALFGGGNVLDVIAEFLCLFTGLMVIPMLACWVVGGKEPERKSSQAIGVFLNYIFTPVLLIYTVILYAYSLKILISWELPQGGVACMVLAYMGIALICYLLGYAADRRSFGWFYRWFPVISIPAMSLLWVGTLRRIIDYGFTEERVYLLALVVLVTIFDILTGFERTRRFREMTIVLGVVAAVISFIPGIRAKDLGIRSQQVRFEKVLPLIVKDGAFAKPDYAALAKDAELARAWRSAKEMDEYLRFEMDEDEYAEKYGHLGRLEFIGSNLDWAKENDADAD